jgi:hypothetical protein
MGITQIIGYPQPKSPLVLFQLHHLLVSQYQLHHEHSHLGQSQQFTHTGSRPSTEDQRSQMLILLCFILLPPLRHEFMGIFEDVRIVKNTHPAASDRCPFLHRHTSNCCVLDQISIENAYNNVKYPRSLKNTTFQILKLLEILVSDICVSLHH